MTISKDNGEEEKKEETRERNVRERSATLNTPLRLSLEKKIKSKVYVKATNQWYDCLTMKRNYELNNLE